jgi:hypothetical protein
MPGLDGVELVEATYARLALAIRLENEGGVSLRGLGFEEGC